jgi:hypothetical protein
MGALEKEFVECVVPVHTQCQGARVVATGGYVGQLCYYYSGGYGRGDWVVRSLIA